MKIPADQLIVTPVVKLRVEMLDPFGTVMGKGEIVLDSQSYPSSRGMSASRLSTIQVKMKVGRYVQADGPDPDLPCVIRVTRP
jgi:hypothetical protein